MTPLTICPCHTMLFQWQWNTTSLLSGLNKFHDSANENCIPFLFCFNLKIQFHFSVLKQFLSRQGFHFTSVREAFLSACPQWKHFPSIFIPSRPSSSFFSHSSPYFRNVSVFSSSSMSLLYPSLLVFSCFWLRGSASFDSFVIDSPRPCR